MKYIITLLIFHSSLFVSAQKLFKINDTYSVAVIPSQQLYDGTKVQFVEYDSVNKVLYVEDACSISLKLYPAEPSGISYKIVDSVNQSNYSQSMRIYDNPQYSYLRLVSSTGNVSINGTHLIKVKTKFIRTIFPIIVDMDKQTIHGTISSDFLTKNKITVMTTTSSNSVPFSCGHNYYGSFRLRRNGTTSIIIIDTLTSSFNLQEGDKLIGVIDPKACNLLNGGYDCIRYEKDFLSDTLYVKNVVTSLTSEENWESDFSFGPNPTSDELFIGKISDIIVYDHMGRKVSESKSVDKISLGSLPIGNYLVDVIVNGSSHRNWIIKR